MSIFLDEQTMESSKVGSWLQIGANLGILAGLILVSAQIFQSNAITGAELFSNNLESTVTRELALVGETPETAMWRVMFDPNNATPQDYFVADRVYLAIFKQYNRARVLSEAGYYGTSDTINAEGFVRINFQSFSCPYGLAWLDQVLASLTAEDPRYRDLKLMRGLAEKRMLANPLIERMEAASEIAKQIPVTNH